MENAATNAVVNATEATQKPAKQPKEKRLTIGDFCRDLIVSGELKTDEIVAAAKEVFPKSAVNAKHVYWYTTKLRAAGFIA